MRVDGQSCVLEKDINNKEIPKRSTKLREMAVLSCKKSMEKIDLTEEKLNSLTAGIVGFSYFGENYPEKWKMKIQNGKRIRPHEFGMSILNSVIGHCSIELNLTGPQIAIMLGNPFKTARIYLNSGRADLIFYCDYSDPMKIETSIIRKEEK